MNHPKFSPEILDLIFDEGPMNMEFFKTCALVCRSLRFRAHSYSFKYIELMSCARLDSLLDILAVSPHIVQFIKTIKTIPQHFHAVHIIDRPLTALLLLLAGCSNGHPSITLIISPPDHILPGVTTNHLFPPITPETAKLAFSRIGVLNVYSIDDFTWDILLFMTNLTDLGIEDVKFAPDWDAVCPRDGGIYKVETLRLTNVENFPALLLPGEFPGLETLEAKHTTFRHASGSPPITVGHLHISQMTFETIRLLVDQIFNFQDLEYLADERNIDSYEPYTPAQRRDFFLSFYYILQVTSSQTLRILELPHITVSEYHLATTPRLDLSRFVILEEAFFMFICDTHAQQVATPPYLLSMLVNFVPNVPSLRVIRIEIVVRKIPPAEMKYEELPIVYHQDAWTEIKAILQAAAEEHVLKVSLDLLYADAGDGGESYPREGLERQAAVLEAWAESNPGTEVINEVFWDVYVDECPTEEEE